MTGVTIGYYKRIENVDWIDPSVCPGMLDSPGKFFCMYKTGSDNNGYVDLRH